MKPVVYQAFVRHFVKDKGKNIPNGTIQENGCGKFNDFNSKALKNIRNFGATHIWFTGVIEHASQTAYNQYNIKADSSDIVKGIAGSPYAIRDYYDVSADLAENVADRMKEFENLVKRAHKADLKVIIDFVPNHLARTYHSDIKPELDFGKDDDRNIHFSSKNDFYYFPNQPFLPQFKLKTYSEFPAAATGNDCFTPSPSKNDWYETIKLNYGVDYQDNRREYFEPIPDTWLKMRDILLFWTEKGVDGFRCDMAEMVPVNFWHWAIAQVKNEFPNTVFIAEIYNHLQYKNYLDYGKFDFLYDKVGLYDTLRGVICGYFSAKKITECWQNLNEIQNKMLNFLENHDEQRIASDFFAKNANAAKPALLVSACLNTSAVMIYAGQELGEKGMDCEGFSGLDGRTTIFDYWQPYTLSRWIGNGDFSLKNFSQEKKTLRGFYKKVLNICNSCKAVSDGAFFDLMYENIENKYFNSEKCFSFLRKYENEVLLIAANFSAEKQNLKIKIPQHAFEYLQIPQNEKIIAKDLLTNKKFCANFCANLLFDVEIDGFSGKIIEIN
ncbi:MAG: alpha-amylase [Prevotellaceae bacterium]|jgi:glycosidase|nr:alpha-amylase [Prevotellaceae bacterium]